MLPHEPMNREQLLHLLRSSRLYELEKQCQILLNEAFPEQCAVLYWFQAAGAFAAGQFRRCRALMQKGKESTSSQPLAGDVFSANLAIADYAANIASLEDELLPRDLVEASERDDIEKPAATLCKEWDEILTHMEGSGLSKNNVAAFLTVAVQLTIVQLLLASQSSLPLRTPPHETAQRALQNFLRWSRSLITSADTRREASSISPALVPNSSPLRKRRKITDAITELFAESLLAKRRLANALPEGVSDCVDMLIVLTAWSYLCSRELRRTRELIAELPPAISPPPALYTVSGVAAMLQGDFESAANEFGRIQPHAFQSKSIIYTRIVLLKALSLLAAGHIDVARATLAPLVGPNVRVQLPCVEAGQALTLFAICEICSAQHSQELWAAVHTLQRAVSADSADTDPCSAISMYNLAVCFDALGQRAATHRLLEFILSVKLPPAKWAGAVWATAVPAPPLPPLRIARSGSGVQPHKRPRLATLGEISPLFLLRRYARTLIEQSKYSEAVEAYSYLIEQLVDPQHRQASALNTADIVAVFREFVHVLLNRRQFARALAMCEHILASCAHEAATCGVDIIALIQKADALVGLTRPLDALACIECVLKLLDAMQQAATEKALLIGHTAPTNLRGNELLFDPVVVRTLRVQALNNKSVILASLVRHAEAASALEAALALLPPPTELLGSAPNPTLSTVSAILYNLTLLNLQSGRTDAAVDRWFVFRGLHRSSDPKYYEDQIRQRTVRAEPMGMAHPAEVRVYEEVMQRLDVLLLRTLLAQLNGTRST